MHIAVTTVRSLHQMIRPINGDMLDHLFGIKFYESEKLIRDTKYDPVAIALRWPKRNTFTSYSKIRQIYRCLTLCDGSSFYDLGSGYGRVLLYGAKWPAILGSSVYMLYHGRYFEAVLVLIWPFAAVIFSIPGRVDVIRMAFAKRIILDSSKTLDEGVHDTEAEDSFFKATQGDADAQILTAIKADKAKKSSP